MKSAILLAHPGAFGSGELKNHSSDVYNHNLEQMYMDNLEKFKSIRIQTMIGLNDRQLF